MDNEPRHRIHKTSVECYTAKFPMLRTTFRGAVQQGYIADPKKGAAMWATPVTHLNMDVIGRRVVFVDNYSKRHSLAETTTYMNARNLRTVGIVSLNYVDRWKSENVKIAVAQMKHAERGSWLLVRVYDVPNTAALHSKNGLEQ